MEKIQKRRKPFIYGYMAESGMAVWLQVGGATAMAQVAVGPKY